MSISFQCPGCAQAFQVTDEWGGRPCRCNCGTELLVPSAASVSIAFACASCARPFELGTEWAGKLCRCGCGAVLTVPAVAPIVAAPSLASLLDEALSPPKPKPVEPWERASSAPDNGFQQQPGAHSANPDGGYFNEAPRGSRTRSGRRRSGPMPPSVNNAGLGLFGCAGISFVLAGFVGALIAFVGIEANNTGYALAIIFICLHIFIAIAGVACGTMLWKRVPGSIPICALAGVPFMLGTPLHLIFVLVLYANLFSRDTREWIEA